MRLSDVTIISADMQIQIYNPASNTHAPLHVLLQVIREIKEFFCVIFLSPSFFLWQAKASIKAPSEAPKVPFLFNQIPESC